MTQGTSETRLVRTMAHTKMSYAQRKERKYRFAECCSECVHRDDEDEDRCNKHSAIIGPTMICDDFVKYGVR